MSGLGAGRYELYEVHIGMSGYEVQVYKYEW